VGRGLANLQRPQVRSFARKTVGDVGQEHSLIDRGGIWLAPKVARTLCMLPSFSTALS
jgi:hypothetical protein